MAVRRDLSNQVKSVMPKSNAELWLKLEKFYDLECERRAGKALEIERQVQPVGAQ